MCNQRQFKLQCPFAFYCLDRMFGFIAFISIIKYKFITLNVNVLILMQ